MEINDLAKLMHQRFDTLEALLGEKTKFRKVKRETSRNLMESRVRTLESFFWKLINSPLAVRRDTYKFSKYLLERSVDPHIEAMSLSVLINQVALRKPFQTKGEGDPPNATAQELARLAVEASNLIILPVQDTVLDLHSDTLLAMSPGEALRLGNSSAALPRVFRGWSCPERATGHTNTAGKYVEPPEDPCGPRNWHVADSGVLVEKLKARKSRNTVISEDVVEETPKTTGLARMMSAGTKHNEEIEEPEDFVKPVPVEEESDGDREEREDRERDAKKERKPWKFEPLD